jgi:hypothetical protein
MSVWPVLFCVGALAFGVVTLFGYGECPVNAYTVWGVAAFTVAGVLGLVAALDWGDRGVAPWPEPAGWGSTFTGPTPPVPQPAPGDVWTLIDGGDANPFAEPLTVRVVEVRRGWVQYAYDARNSFGGRDMPLSEMPISKFHGFYTRTEPPMEQQTFRE